MAPPNTIRRNSHAATTHSPPCAVPAHPPAAQKPAARVARARVLRPTPASATQVTSPAQAVKNLKSAEGVYKSYQSQLAQRNTQLAGELAKLSPALTGAQRNAYVKAYHDKYKKDYAGSDAAAQKLASALNDPSLDRAVQGSPAEAYAVADAAKTLAGSGRSADVLRWVAHAFSPSNPAHVNYGQIGQPLQAKVPGGRFVGMQTETVHGPVNVIKEIVEPSLAGAAAQLVGQAHGNAKLAFDQYKTILTNISQGVKGAKFLHAGIKITADLIQGVEHGDSSAWSLTNVLHGKVSTGFFAAGVVLAAFSAKTDFQKKQYADAVRQLAYAGRGATHMAADALHALSSLTSSPDARGFVDANFLDRLSPALGLVGNAVALGLHAEAFGKNPTVGGGIQVAGDAISVIGAGIETVIPGPGMIVEGAGLLISGIGGLIGGIGARNATNAEESALLKKVGVGATAAGALGGSSHQISDLNKQLLMTPPQIQQLANGHPDIFSAPGYGNAFINAAKAFQMSGSNVNPFADSLAKENPGYMEPLFAQQMAQNPAEPSVHLDQIRTALEGRFPKTMAFVRQQEPQLFGAAAAARQQADYQFAEARGFGWANVCNLVKGNQNPSYQAQVIKLMKDEGTLGIFVHQMGSNYAFNGWPEAARQALGSAEKAGVLSAPEASTYEAQLGG